jgi:hypothetical protein
MVPSFVAFIGDTRPAIAARAIEAKVLSTAGPPLTTRWVTTIRH